MRDELVLAARIAFMEKKYLSLIVLLSLFLFCKIALSNTPSYDFLGTYQLYSQFDEKTKKYVHVNLADKTLRKLTFDTQSIQIGDSSCKNVTYHVIPKELVNWEDTKAMFNEVLKANKITLSKMQLVKIKGNQCDLMIVFVNDNYLLLLSHDNLPILYIKK